MTRACTCLGVCKGKDGLGPGWICALEDTGGKRETASGTRLSNIIRELKEQCSVGCLYCTVTVESDGVEHHESDCLIAQLELTASEVDATLAAKDKELADLQLQKRREVAAAYEQAMFRAQERDKALTTLAALRQSVETIQAEWRDKSQRQQREAEMARRVDDGAEGMYNDGRARELEACADALDRLKELL